MTYYQNNFRTNTEYCKSNTSPLSAFYDVQSDALYVSLREEASHIEERDNVGFFRRFADADGKPIGVTIVGFLGNWGDTREMAYGNISAFLRIDIDAVRRAIMPLLPVWSI